MKSMSEREDLEALVIGALIRNPDWKPLVTLNLFTQDDCRKIYLNLKNNPVDTSAYSGVELSYILTLWNRPADVKEDFLFKVERLKYMTRRTALISFLKVNMEELIKGEDIDVIIERIGEYTRNL